MKPATPEQTARFFKGTKKHPLFYATIPVVSAAPAPQPEPEQIPVTEKESDHEL